MGKKIIKIKPIYFLVDIAIMLGVFITSFLVKYSYFIGEKRFINWEYLQEYSSIFFLWILFLSFSLYLKNLYATDRSLSIAKEIKRTVVSVVYASLLIGAVVYFAGYDFFSRYIFFISVFALIFFLSLFRVIKRLWLRRLIAKGFHNFNVLIVGTDISAEVLRLEVEKNPWLGYKIVGFLDQSSTRSLNGLPVLGTLKDFSSVVKKYFIDEVIVVMSMYEASIPELISQAKKMRIGIRLFPTNDDKNFRVVNINYLGVIPLIAYGEKNYFVSGFVFKRLFDIFSSLLLIILLFPVFLIITLLIRIDSPGPIFYSHPRMGIKGTVFKFYKFRSMVSKADSLKERLLSRNEVKDGVIFKIRKDPRVTKIGSFLRKYSLDELPQLFNVLKGDMSLVGPRPFPIEESKRIQHYHLPRLNIRPGMTGLSQVRGRSELSFRNWMRWDLWYVNNWSFGLDLQIILWTIPVVFRGKGAY